MQGYSILERQELAALLTEKEHAQQTTTGEVALVAAHALNTTRATQSQRTDTRLVPHQALREPAWPPPRR